MAPTSVLLPGEFRGQRRLVGYSPWGCKESNTTECLNTHTGILHCQSLAIVKFCITAIYTEQEIKPQNMS